MKKRILFLTLLAVVTVTAPAQQKYPWQNPQLPTAERVENLISMLTPEEKVGLMMNKSVSIDRLGIPSYNWWSEACHGVRQGGYTVFPQPIGMAAAFSEKLIYDVFSAVSDEARANWNRTDHNDPKLFNVPMGVIYYPGNPELTFWCPNVNIFRDPRWGRGQETCGEDPYMNAVLGVQTVLGMQGNDKHYFKTHACAKHYAVHSGPEPLRHSMNVEPTNRDLWETYLPAFKALVKKADVREVMCAYQRFEGKPCCTSDRLLIDILRNKWGYDGIVLTDCDAINNFFNRGQHETHKDGLSASVDAVLNGTDSNAAKSLWYSPRPCRRTSSRRNCSTSTCARRSRAASNSVCSIPPICSPGQTSAPRSSALRPSTHSPHKLPASRWYSSKTKAMCSPSPRTSRRSPS